MEAAAMSAANTNVFCIDLQFMNKEKMVTSLIMGF